jgi:hypothetical protein
MSMAVMMFASVLIASAAAGKAPRKMLPSATWMALVIRLTSASNMA